MKLSITAMAILLMAIPSQAGDDRKAPPPLFPPVSLKDSQTPEYKAAASRVLINRLVEQKNLPYITVEGHDVKIAISPEILAAYKVSSGAALPAKKVYEIIDADRNFERGLKEVAPKQGVIVE